MPHAHGMVTSCCGLCRKRDSIVDDEIGSEYVHDIQNDAAFVGQRFLSNRLPTNVVSDTWAWRKFQEVDTYIKGLIALLVLCMAFFGLWCAFNLYSEYKEEERVRLIMSGRENVDGSAFVLSYHGHIHMKKFDNVDEYSRDASMQRKCRPITRREYVTRVLDHDIAVADSLKEVDYRDEDVFEEFEENIAKAVRADLDFIAHALCHHAHNLHLSAASDQPVFVTPKMLRIEDLKVAMRKGHEETSPFVSIPSLDLPDVCMMAYVRPDDDLAKSDIATEAVLRDGDERHGRKPFESALGIDSDAFVHMSAMGVWPEHAGANEKMAEDNAGRLYVVDQGLSASDTRMPARTWWNSGLHAIGPPGECVIFVNPKYVPKSNTGKKQFVDVYRRSVIIPKHNKRDVVFGSHVSRKGTLEHDIVINTTLPDALMSVNSTEGFLHDESNSFNAKLAFDTLQKNAEAQIVADFMNGKWAIFDEIKRGMRFEQMHDHMKR